MKKSKLLTPLIVTGALGASIAPILATTSCSCFPSKPDQSKFEITTLDGLTEYEVGDTVNISVKYDGTDITKEVYSSGTITTDGTVIKYDATTKTFTAAAAGENGWIKIVHPEYKEATLENIKVVASQYTRLWDKSVSYDNSLSAFDDEYVPGADAKYTPSTTESLEVDKTYEVSFNLGANQTKSTSLMYNIMLWNIESGALHYWTSEELDSMKILVGNEERDVVPLGSGYICTCVWTQGRWR